MRTALLALLLVCAANAEAQQRPQLRVLVEALDEDAAKCGVSKSQLESIAALTLRNNGIQVVTERTNPFLYVAAIFLQTSIGGCAYTTQVTVRGFRDSDNTNAPLGGFKSRKGSHTEFCGQSGINFGKQALVTTTMTRVLENMIKQCLGQLDY